MSEAVEDAFERFMYARSQLADTEQLLRAAKLTVSRTFPLYTDDDLRGVGEAVARYAACAERLARASDVLAAAIAADSANVYPRVNAQSSSG